MTLSTALSCLPLLAVSALALCNVTPALQVILKYSVDVLLDMLQDLSMARL